MEAGLPEGWEDVRLTLATEQPGDVRRAAQVLGPMSPGHAGDTLALVVRRAGGASGPEAARRLFARLDRDRVWCVLAAGNVSETTMPTPGTDDGLAGGVADRWDEALATLPADWTDLLCELAVGSSVLLPRAALLCAPINPTRDRGTLGFVFRCARRAGYGVSPGMARQCFARLDTEGIAAEVSIVRVLSDTHNVGTQGAVWLVGGRTL